MTDITITEKSVGILTVGTWPKWSRKCKAILRANGMWPYIEGDKTQPPSEAGKIPIWNEMNDRIVGALCHVVEDSLLQEIEEFRSASEAWMHLKRKTYQHGVNSKFHAIQSAMRLRFSNSTSISSTLTELKDCLDAIYSDKILTREELTAGILLHAMTDTPFDGLRDILMTSATALTPTGIIQSMEAKAQEARHRESIKNDDTILAAKQKQSGSSSRTLRCSNCNRNGHTLERCWEKGGGSVGKAPAWWNTMKENQRKGDDSKRKERAHAAISDAANSDSGSEACAILRDTHHHNPSTDCSVNWNQIIASAVDSLPYYFDSGATSHCSPNRDDFSDIRSIPPREIRGINGSSISAVAVGTIKLRCGKGRRLHLRDALYIPDAQLRLISIGKLGDMGLLATFTAKKCSIIQGSRTIAQGTRTGNGLYHLSDKITVEHLLHVRAAPDLETWHRRLGHVNYSSIIHMAEKSLVTGMPTNLSNLPPICDHCILGKQTRTPVPKVREGERAQRRLEKVFLDITGPEDTQTAYGELYTLNFIDDFSQKTWVYILKRKADAFERFKEWQALVTRETNLAVNIFRTDNGGEYTSKTFEKYLQDDGIKHQTTAPHTSAQNGKAERLHRTLFDRARAIMSENNFPPKLWGECIKAAAYLKDRTPTRTLKDMTPHEAYYGSKPDISHLRELGCRTFILTQSERHRKIYNRSIEGILVGYSETSKAYQCYYPPTGRILVSRHVSFIESQDARPRPYRPGVEIGTDAQENLSDFPQPIPLEYGDSDRPNETEQSNQYDSEGETNEEETNPDQIGTPSPEAPRRSRRSQKLSAAGAAMRGVTYETLLERAKREIREMPNRRPEIKNIDSISEDMFAATAADTEISSLDVRDDDPRTYKQASKAYDAEHWDEGYDNEMDSLRQHGVWTLVPRSTVPKSRKIIGSRPVFFRKRNEANEVTRRKVRVVAKGYSQVEGVDYSDTFAPVARLESVRTVLGIAAILDWEIHQFDVKTAFLHGKLTEDIYMEQPEGRKEEGREDWVCKLHKSLYGLRQAGRCWYERLYGEMQKVGFTRVSVDHSVFVKRGPQGDAMVTIHVDDMAVATSNKHTMTSIYNDLRKIIDIVDMGDIHWFLGMAITRDRQARTISLSQKGFIDTILKRFRMENSYGVSTPLDPDVVLSKSMSPTSEEEKQRMKSIPYLAGVGSLMYASLATRPDITFATNRLSQFNSNPGQAHWTALLRVLRYLKHTRNYVLVLGGQEKITLEGYTDSDYAGCVDTRRSTSGYAFTLGCGSISWSSKRQAIVTTSSCEAEYVASCNAAKEAMWLCRLLEFLGHKQTTPKIHSDNTASITLTKDPAFHARSKHIDVQYHYTRERVENKELSFHYLPTSEMAADIFTKALP